MRESMFVAFLIVASACVVAGVALISAPAALIVSGGFVAGLAYLVFGDV